MVAAAITRILGTKDSRNLLGERLGGGGGEAAPVGRGYPIVVL